MKRNRILELLQLLALVLMLVYLGFEENSSDSRASRTAAA